MEEDIVELEPQNTPEGEPEPQDGGQETLSPEDIADLKHKAEVSSQNFERAKKAEAEKKALEVELAKAKQTPSDSLTAKDVLALSSEGITQGEDVEFAEKWAKFNGKSVSDTLQDPTFKSIMEKRQEERKTASATQTKGGAKGVSKITGEELLRKASKGEFPESEEDINKMLDAKFEAKKQANKR